MFSGEVEQSGYVLLSPRQAAVTHRSQFYGADEATPAGENLLEQLINGWIDSEMAVVGNHERCALRRHFPLETEDGR